MEQLKSRRPKLFNAIDGVFKRSNAGAVMEFDKKLSYRHRALNDCGKKVVLSTFDIHLKNVDTGRSQGGRNR